MAVCLEPRNNDFSCVHDAFVHSYNADLLEPPAEDVIRHIPDNFPLHSLKQLCSMLRTELHVNCRSMILSREPLIQIFANPVNPYLQGDVGGHLEFLRPVDLEGYIEERPHLVLVGFIAFRGIDCAPFENSPESHHILKDMEPMRSSSKAAAV